MHPGIVETLQKAAHDLQPFDLSFKRGDTISIIAPERHGNRYPGKKPEPAGPGRGSTCKCQILDHGSIDVVDKSPDIWDHFRICHDIEIELVPVTPHGDIQPGTP